MHYVPSGPEEAEFLKNYDPYAYELPAVTVDMALFAFDGAALSLLLIRRGGYPFRGCLALPGGFLEMSESPREAAARELLEETGVSGVTPVQIYTLGEPGRDPRHRILSVLHLALVDAAAVVPRAGDDAAEALWFSLEGFSREGSALALTLRGPGGETLSPAGETGPGDLLRAPRLPEIACDHTEAILRAFLALRRSLVCGDIARQLWPEGAGEAQLSALCRAAFLPAQSWRKNPFFADRRREGVF